MTFMFPFKSHYRLVQNVLPHTPKFVTTTRKENCSELKIEQLQRISEKFITQAKVNERKTQTGRSYDRKSFVCTFMNHTSSYSLKPFSFEYNQ